MFLSRGRTLQDMLFEIYMAPSLLLYVKLYDFHGHRPYIKQPYRLTSRCTRIKTLELCTAFFLNTKDT